MTIILDLNSEDYKRYLEVKTDKIKNGSKPVKTKRGPVIFHSSVEIDVVKRRNDEEDSHPISRCFPKSSNY